MILCLSKGQRSKKKDLLKRLAEEDLPVLGLAYACAKDIQMYGVVITEKWETAIQNASALEKAYKKGYYDALAGTNSKLRKDMNKTEFLRALAEGFAEGFSDIQVTNGDVIRALFPNVSVYEHGSTYSLNNEYNFNSTWWNAPYESEGK